MSVAALSDPVVRAFLAAARLGHLATADARGVPAVVPICFTVQGARLFTPIDAKPKRADWRGLQRVRNVLANPHVAVVVDRWDEDWRRLGWVHLRGRSALLEGGPLHGEGVTALRAKYAQYREMPLESAPVLAVEINAARHWGDLTPPAGP